MTPFTVTHGAVYLGAARLSEDMLNGLEELFQREFSFASVVGELSAAWGARDLSFALEDARAEAFRQRPKQTASIARERV